MDGGYMKIKLFILCFGLLGAIECDGMMRSARVPVRKPITTRNYSEVARIQSKYSLPKPLHGSQLVSELTREQLATHLKHQELCWNLFKSKEATKEAKKQVTRMAAQLVKSSAKQGLITILAYNSCNDSGPELFATIKDETLLSFQMARAAVREYKLSQEKVISVQQMLEALVAEQKLQLKVPYDIQ